MRWFVRTLAALFLVWAIYLVSPYVALYGLARAVEARDMVLIRERVDFPALRLSLARQISAAYAKVLGGKREGDPGSSLGATAGAAVLAPLLEPYVSADAVLRLIREGWPGLAGSGAPGEAGSPAGSGARDLGLFDPATFLTARNLSRLWDATEWRGFRTFLVRLPQRGAAEEPPQLQFRLSAFTWRLSGIELPADLKDRLVHDLAARQTVERK